MKEQENLESAGHYDRYDLGTMVVCIKPYGKLSEGSHYQIDGCGSLDLNMDPRRGSKSGFGFSVKYESYDVAASTEDILIGVIMCLTGLVFLRNSL